MDNEERARVGLALFARAPLPGRTKTRLSPFLSADEASALYEAFLRDVLGRFTSVPWAAVTVWVSEADEQDYFRKGFSDLEVRVQRAGDLGERMVHALHITGKDRIAAMVVGTDLPTLPEGVVKTAVDRLCGGDPLVFGPAVDGGYFLVGTRGSAPDVFSQVPWSSPETLAHTVRRARNVGVMPSFVSPWYDVDEPGDLRLLWAHVQAHPEAAPHTHRAMVSQNLGHRLAITIR